MNKKWMTLEFWVAILSAVGMLVVTLGIASQESVEAWIALLSGLVAAVLPIVVLITGYANQRAAGAERGLIAEDTPSYLTVEFWLAIGATAAMILTAGRIISQEQADTYLALLGPLVASILAIVAYVRGRLVVKTAALLR